MSEDLDEIAAALDDVRVRVDRVDRNYSDRKGFIGTEEARSRYEDAVYAYLVGEHRRAANLFYTLVESGVLGRSALVNDSEWYLAECLFEMGNYGTATEYYRRILGKGSRHAFFADSVRRLIEIFGITGDQQSFTAIYGKYIRSGQVATTDAIQYAVGKSLYRQGDFDGALDALVTVQEGSSFYPRSQYFIGTVYTAWGRLTEAVGPFERALAISPTNSQDREVVELANLALGRVHYELEDYARATDHYQDISSD
ncbi:MAG: tetratricopeptide repeat protein, partial [Myxococcota bacterium]|nr:tetratricopeptide repeat protein [Myxococcota bacterium]